MSSLVECVLLPPYPACERSCLPLSICEHQAAAKTSLSRITRHSASTSMNTFYQRIHSLAHYAPFFLHLHLFFYLLSLTHTHTHTRTHAHTHTRTHAHTHTHTCIGFELTGKNLQCLPLTCGTQHSRQNLSSQSSRYVACLLCVPNRGAREHILQENQFYKRTHCTSARHMAGRWCMPHVAHARTQSRTKAQRHTHTHTHTCTHTHIRSHAHAHMNATTRTATTTDQHLASSAIAQEHVSKAQRAG
jgi:hypothetical protein